MESYIREIPNHFSLPKRVNRLGELAYNLWWVWNQDAQELYERIDKILWEDENHNPVSFLKKVDRALINASSNDRDYVALYDDIMNRFDSYMKKENTWINKEYKSKQDQLIAYFSFEFGLHESLPVYAGGLGVLSGDHMKEASDLGLPFIGIGFIYRQGYFTQHITEDGWQETSNYYLDLDSMPVIPLFDQNHEPLMISVQLPDREVWARLWEVQIGRVKLMLLDSDVEKNSTHDRQLTARLYSNDLEIRISQEIMLGIGGAKAIKKVGLEPKVWHMNEGHSAFLSIQRIYDLVKEGKTFDEAVHLLKDSNLFTTHTPVPAGIDQFPIWMMDKYFSWLWPELNITRDQFIDLGRHEQSWGENFSMPVLALNLSSQCNGVSELHGRVSRKMWHFLYPDVPVEDVPIGHVTNGVHCGTWMSNELLRLFEQYFGEDCYDNFDDSAMWDQIDRIPDDKLWAVHQTLKDRLMHFATRRARKMWLSNKYHPVQILAAGSMLNEKVLTIGFARRFATYKRAYLLLQDFDRLLRIINDAERPVQFIFAGKAHPADEPGKLIIQRLYRAIKDSRTGGRLVFLEDYDMNIARYMVQGVDVWMNTPRRPNEASGTSGMKAAMNGVLNFSILDGWWREGYNEANGWKIGTEAEYQDAARQDEEDMESMFSTLENKIIPLFYDEYRDGTPSNDWIQMMKQSIRTLAPQFSMKRMVKEYMTEYYINSMK